VAIVKVHIDKEICAGCGSCEVFCPEVFRIEDDIAVNVLGEEKVVPDGVEEKCREAVDTCPVEAISIEE
jgi:ferredoxin